MSDSELSKLKKRLQEMEKEAEANRKKREYKTTAIFAIVFFLIFCFFEGIPKSKEIFTYIVSSLFAAFLHYMINHEVFHSIIENENLENKELSQIRNRVFELEQQEFDQRVSEAKRKIMSDND